MATSSFGVPWVLTEEQAEYLLSVLDDENEGVEIPQEEIDAFLEELKLGEELTKQFVLARENREI